MSVRDISNKLFSDLEHEKGSIFFLSENKYYLEQIRKCNYQEFLAHNFQENATTYNNQLLSILPFLWEKITHSDIDTFLINFTKNKSYQGLINIFSFCSKYLKLDILNYYLELDLPLNDYKKIFKESEEGILPLLYLYPHEINSLKKIDESLLEKFFLLGEELAIEKFEKMPNINDYKILGRVLAKNVTSQNNENLISRLFRLFKG